MSAITSLPNTGAESSVLDSTDIASKVSKGVMWSIGQQLAINVVSFGGYIILARLLTPKDFGLFAFASVFIVLFQTFITTILLGGVMLALTLTKSGLFMILAGSGGFLFMLAIGRNQSCRRTALLGTIAAVLMLAGLLSAPGDLGNYFRAEVGTALNLQEQTGQAGGSGLATRVECWKLALYSVAYYPLGVGGWGIDNVLNRTTAIVPTPEMRLFFDQDMYGLKSTLANLIAQTGLIGISLLGFWIWSSFMAPAFQLLKAGTYSDTLLASLYGASASLSLVFLFSCELYPSFALLLFLKLHADSIAARMHVAEQEVSFDNAVEHLAINSVAA